MKANFSKMLKESGSIVDVFDIVKETVDYAMDMRRPGLMLGMVEAEEGFPCAFHPPGSNFIFVSEAGLKKVSRKNPKLYKPYLFNVLLYEYLRSLGFLEDGAIRKISVEVGKKMFGKNDAVAKVAKNFGKMFPTCPHNPEKFELKDAKITIVNDFDSSSAAYLR